MRQETFAKRFSALAAARDFKSFKITAVPSSVCRTTTCLAESDSLPKCSYGDEELTGKA